MEDPATYRRETEARLGTATAEELALIPIWISMDPLPDEAETGWAEGICLALSRHDDPWVCGNAVLAFGHLARTVGRIGDETAVRATVLAALCDSHPHVRGQAHSARDDLSHFLGWAFPGAES